MTATEVQYHRDGWGPGRPAVDVKDHHAGMDYRIALERLVGSAAGADAIEAEDDYPGDGNGRAYSILQERFWQDAETLAEEYGLGPIEQEGRSGGWLVLTDGRDPQDPETFCADTAEDDGAHAADATREWLAAYRKLRDWCEAEVASAPARVAALAQSLAIDAAGERTITLRSWLAWGKEYAL